MWENAQKLWKQDSDLVCKKRIRERDLPLVWLGERSIQRNGEYKSDIMAKLTEPFNLLRRCYEICMIKFLKLRKWINCWKYISNQILKKKNFKWIWLYFNILEWQPKPFTRFKKKYNFKLKMLKILKFNIICASEVLEETALSCTADESKAK